MSTTMEPIVAGFEAWGRFVARRSVPVLAVSLLLALMCAAPLVGLRFDNSIEAFLHEDDPALLAYDRYREQFGSDDVVVVLIESERIFELDLLQWLERLHTALERDVPHVDGVTSLVNARHTRGEVDQLIVEPLLADWPVTPTDLAELRERVHANPLYLGRLIARDDSLTVVAIEPSTYSDRESDVSEDLVSLERTGDTVPAAYLSDAETAEMIRAIRDVIDAHPYAHARVWLAGAPVMGDHNTRLMQRDIARFVVVLLCVVATVLFLLFRRALAVLIPALVVSLSVAASFGIMAALDIGLSLPLQILPSFLLAVGVCDSVHLLAVFYQRIRAGDTRPAAIEYALGHSGLPVVLTSATTAGGLLSFNAAEIAPIAHLGIVAPLGIVLAMLLSLTLLPALLVIVPAAPERRAPASESRGAVRHWLDLCVSGTTGRPFLTTVACLAIVVIVGAGALRLRFSQDQLSWLPESDPVRQATELVDTRLDGVASVELLAQTNTPGRVKTKDFLERLAAVRRSAPGLGSEALSVSSSLSVLDIVEEVHQALNEDDATARRIPESEALLAQELLLFEIAAPEDLRDFVDSSFGLARVSMSAPWVDAIHYPPFLAELEAHFGEILGPYIDIEITGRSALLGRTYSALVHSMATSFALALALIAPLMVLLTGSFRRGLLAMVPNLAPIVFVLGLMGWLDIPLDIFTLLIGSTLLGLAVDDTIHVFYQVQRFETQGATRETAIREAIRSTGAALLATSLILAGGFFVFTLAHMQNLQSFGLLSGASTLVAFLADLLLAPALLILASRAVRPR